MIRSNGEASRPTRVRSRSPINVGHLAVYRPNVTCAVKDSAARDPFSIAESAGGGRQSHTATVMVRRPNLGLAATMRGTAASPGVDAAGAVALKRTVAR